MKKLTKEQIIERMEAKNAIYRDKIERLQKERPFYKYHYKRAKGMIARARGKAEGCGNKTLTDILGRYLHELS